MASIKDNSLYNGPSMFNGSILNALGQTWNPFGTQPGQNMDPGKAKIMGDVLKKNLEGKQQAYSWADPIARFISNWEQARQFSNAGNKAMHPWSDGTATTTDSSPDETGSTDGTLPAGAQTDATPYVPPQSPVADPTSAQADPTEVDAAAEQGINQAPPQMRASPAPDQAQGTDGQNWDLSNFSEDNPSTEKAGQNNMPAAEHLGGPMPAAGDDGSNMTFLGQPLKRTGENDRRAIIAEVEKDPQLLWRLIALSYAEQGDVGALTGKPVSANALARVMESMGNRLYANQQIGDGSPTTFKGVISQGAYYQPYQNGSYDAWLSRVRHDPALQQKGMEAARIFFGGSNMIHDNMHNGSQGVAEHAAQAHANFMRDNETGEGFSTKRGSPGDRNETGVQIPKFAQSPAQPGIQQVAARSVAPNGVVDDTKFRAQRGNVPGYRNPQDQANPNYAFDPRTGQPNPVQAPETVGSITNDPSSHPGINLVDQSYSQGRDTPQGEENMEAPNAARAKQAYEAQSRQPMAAGAQQPRASHMRDTQGVINQAYGKPFGVPMSEDEINAAGYADVFGAHSVGRLRALNNARIQPTESDIGGGKVYNTPNGRYYEPHLMEMELPGGGKGFMTQNMPGEGPQAIVPGYNVYHGNLAQPRTQMMQDQIREMQGEKPMRLTGDDPGMEEIRKLAADPRFATPQSAEQVYKDVEAGKEVTPRPKLKYMETRVERPNLGPFNAAQGEELAPTPPQRTPQYGDIETQGPIGFTGNLKSFYAQKEYEGQAAPQMMRPLIENEANKLQNNIHTVSALRAIEQLENDARAGKDIISGESGRYLQSLNTELKALGLPTIGDAEAPTIHDALGAALTRLAGPLVREVSTRPAQSEWLKTLEAAGGGEYLKSTASRRAIESMLMSTAARDLHMSKAAADTISHFDEGAWRSWPQTAMAIAAKYPVRIDMRGNYNVRNPRQIPDDYTKEQVEDIVKNGMYEGDVGTWHGRPVYGRGKKPAGY